MQVIRYNQEYRNQWDEFVNSSANGTFLLTRGFMEYHKERFNDYSLLVFDDKKLITILPANGDKQALYSHSGLTYGGFIYPSSYSSLRVMEAIDLAIEYLREAGFQRLHYKPTPSIYHNTSAQADLYALYRHGATLTGRSISSVIPLQSSYQLSTLRKRQIKKAIAHSLEVEVDGDQWGDFWHILTLNLQTNHHCNPAHSLEEILLLKSLYNTNIKLYTVYNEESSIVAGTVLFITPRCVHVQYIAASEMGKKTGALDMLFAQLIERYAEDYSYFDFGISTEQNGNYLNRGLLHQKEGFGAVATLYDQYQLDL